jgi:hypothetical protein
MITQVRRVCANPVCSCEPSEGGCSPWCRAFDRPAGEQCRCGHEGCAVAPARGVPPRADSARDARRGEPADGPASNSDPG